MFDQKKLEQLRQVQKNWDETKLKQNDEKWLRAPEGYQFWAASRKQEGMRGVLTILKDNLAMRVDKERIIKDPEGRVLEIPIKTLLRGQTMWLINIYAPVADKEISKNYKHRNR